MRGDTARLHLLSSQSLLASRFATFLGISWDKLQFSNPYPRCVTVYQREFGVSRSITGWVSIPFFDIEEARLPGSAGEGSKISITGRGKRPPVKVVIKKKWSSGLVLGVGYYRLDLSLMLGPICFVLRSELLSG